MLFSKFIFVAMCFALTLANATMFNNAIRKRASGFDCDDNNPCPPPHITVEDSFYPHEDPTKYVECDANTGQCSIQDCPDGLVWNEVDFKCVDPVNSTPTPTSRPTSASAGKESSVSDIGSVPVPDVGFECHHFNICTFQEIVGRNFYFPNQDPTLYVQCTVMRCPYGLVWDTAAKTCNQQPTGVSTPESNTPKTEESIPAGAFIPDINECASNPCQNAETCVDRVDGFTCICSAGFTGTSCETDINECASSPCQNAETVTCVDHVNGFTCICSAGFTGSFCETDINECASSPCQNAETCLDQFNGFTCICSAGFTGTSCETDINECASSPCQNDATCVDQVNGYTCRCSAGFTGPFCETDLNDRSCFDLYRCSNEFTSDYCRTIIGDLILRINESIALSFKKEWLNYQYGFLNYFSEEYALYWIGLNKLHDLSQRGCAVRFDLQADNGTCYFIQYSTFVVSGPEDKYRLKIGGYDGNLNDAMTLHSNNKQFFVPPHTFLPPRQSQQCGGWWFEKNDCGTFFTCGNAQTCGVIWPSLGDAGTPPLSLKLVQMRFVC